MIRLQFENITELAGALFAASKPMRTAGMGGETALSSAALWLDMAHRLHIEHASPADNMQESARS
jgi:hypothetical protein